MFSFITQPITNYIAKYGMLILVILIILFILFYWLFIGRNKEGSYSKESLQFKDLLNPKKAFERWTSNLPNTLSDYLSNDNYKIKEKQYNNINPTKSSSSKGEEICRIVLQEHFKKPFISCRPDMLKNEVTGKNLELDCYNSELKLACEYNGRQHYEYDTYFHKTKEQFYAQKYRDILKKDMCKKNGIQLISVPYKIKHANIKEYILSQLSNKDSSSSGL